MASSEDSASSGDERKRFKSVISIAKSSKGRVEADFHEKSYQSRSRSRSRSISPRYDSNQRKRIKHERDDRSDDDQYRSRRRHVEDKENVDRKRKHDDYRERDKRYDAKRKKDIKRRETSDDDNNEKEKEENENQKKKDVLDIMTRTGGAYIPPARLKMMQEGITDKSSTAFQRISWEALKKSINGLVNKVNVSNIANIVQELFDENVIRARGLFALSVMRAQVASPLFTNVYAALLAIVNTKFPKIGELILRRVILQFRRAYRRNNKVVCMNSARFIAHLVNQEIAHELIALEVLTLLLQKPTDDSVEVAVAFLKEVGQKLTEVSPRGLNAVFERLRNVLNEGGIDKRTQYMLEVMFAIRKDGFKDHPAVIPELDLVEEEDQITHLLRLDDDGAVDDHLNVFKHDPDYLENEEKYKQIKKEIIGDAESDESSGEDDEDDNEDDEDDEGAEEEEDTKMDIIDKTETNLVALRRTIYLTIQSSLDYEECAHKMMKMQLKPGQEHEFCLMIIDCCAQQRTYEKFFGLLAQRFCLLKKEFMTEYIKIFKEQYDKIHRYDTNKLRNVAKFFGHLLYTDSIPWTVMECIKLNEDETTSSSRIFIKIVFQTLAEYLGIPKINQRISDPVLAPYFEGMLPRDNPRNTRFAINFFTAIGLGGLTDDLREHLKNAPKKIVMPQSSDDSTDSSDSDDSSDSSDSDSSDSSSEDSSSTASEEERRKSRKERKRRDESSSKNRREKYERNSKRR